MWKQTRAFNQANGGTQKGYCLRNVRLGYGIAAKYATATLAWQHTQQHRDRNVPAGIAVPLYYYYWVNGSNQGHINVRLPNGTVWSDGEIFASITDYENKKAPAFLGWGESVNDVRVVEWVNDPVPPSGKMPPVGSKIQLSPGTTRTTFQAGTTNIAGVIRVTDSSFVYTVRGYDPKFQYRVLINSKTGGGDGVALALYYVSGAIIPGWKVV